jgi:hypothetical protein
MKLGLVAFPWNRLLLLDEALSETPLLEAPLADHDASLQLLDGLSLQHDVSRLDAVLMLSCGGSHNEPQQYLDHIGWLESCGVTVLNPPDVLRWNMDKRHIGDH